MKMENNIQNEPLSDKELHNLVFSQKRFRTQNILLMVIYVALIVLSLFII